MNATDKLIATCFHCNKPFTDENVFTDAGWREIRISGMCEKCFDEITNFEDEEI